MKYKSPWRFQNAMFYFNLAKINYHKKILGVLLALLFAITFTNAQKQITNIAQLPEGIDGIEPVGNGDFILTAWVGYIFYVTAAGNVETLLDTHLEKKNTADIGYDPVKRIVYVPTFNAKTVVAYVLK